MTREAPAENSPTNARTPWRQFPRQKRPPLRPRRPRAARYRKAVDGVPYCRRRRGGSVIAVRLAFRSCARTGEGDEVLMSIAGHVSRAMLSRYSHVRMEAKRRALDEIAARQCAADEKRYEEAVSSGGPAWPQPVGHGDIRQHDAFVLQVETHLFADRRCGVDIGNRQHQREPHAIGGKHDPGPH
jgi:hypothetical protein